MSISAKHPEREKNIFQGRSRILFGEALKEIQQKKNKPAKPLSKR